MKKLLKAFTALFIASPALFGCTKVDAPILAKGISLDITSKSITYDPDAAQKESFVLTATVTPSNYTYGTITWSGGKSYDDEYVKLTPSADGKTCTVTANKVCTDGVNVYAKISGDKQEYSASCEVKVLKKKVHATSIEFTDTTAKTIKVKEAIAIPYTVTPAVNDDLVSATCTVDGIVSATPNVNDKTIIITGKLPGTTKVKISCWDDETKKCESTTEVTITVAEPASLNYTLGETVVNTVSNIATTLNASNTFKITPSANIVLSSTSQMKLMVTEKGGKAVDLTLYHVTVGLMKKGTNNWIFVGLNSEATYSAADPYTLEAGQDYYVVVNNTTPIPANEYDIHVTMPAAK